VISSPGALYHVTVLSNFARGYDKYTRTYRKALIPQSSFPDTSYVLATADLAVGILKASRLLARLQIAGDRLIILEANIEHSQVSPNTRNGLGLIYPSGDLPLRGVFEVSSAGGCARPLGFEEVMAQSLSLHSSTFHGYSQIEPRSVSFLPIAKGCQAACPFCFSEASASADQVRGGLELERVRQWAALAKSRGARRAVITGGGEPTLLPWTRLLGLISICREHYEKVVLITNGISLAKLEPTASIAKLLELERAGLSVLAISRHHQDEVINSALMNFKTLTPTLLQAAAAVDLSSLHLRLICVLQKNGVSSVADIEAYVGWAVSLGVTEICFKELYVATSEESVYFSRGANAWNTAHQVPLKLVHDWALKHSLEALSHLPWGSPVYVGKFAGETVRVAAYTEPSLFWERSVGLARSWNIMSDGSCLVSLEDRASDVSALLEEPACR
jgi:pyruvate-formate lyase-activating enzyme